MRLEIEVLCFELGDACNAGIAFQLELFVPCLSQEEPHRLGGQLLFQAGDLLIALVQHQRLGGEWIAQPAGFSRAHRPEALRLQPVVHGGAPDATGGGRHRELHGL